MGNGASAEADTPTGSGTVLSPELQHQIKQDFEVKVLRDQLKVKTANSELEASQAQRTQQVKQQLAAMEQHYVAKFKTADQQADALNAKFSDLFHQLDYDADQLLKTHQQKQTSERKELCVETRTGLTTCFKEGKGECDYWIKALENCVRDKVLEKQTTQVGARH